MFELLSLKKELVLEAQETDQLIWVPQPDASDVSFRPLFLDTNNGAFANVLRFRKKGVINKHRHHGTVHGYTIKGQWRYLEHNWVAKEDTYIFEPPGETHTLYCDGKSEVFVLFIITGGLTFYDDNDMPSGYMDVFTKIEACKKHYVNVGLGVNFVDQFIR